MPSWGFCWRRPAPSPTAPKGLWISNVPRTVAHLDEVADWRPADDPSAAPRVAGPGQTTSTSSLLPSGVLGAVYDLLGSTMSVMMRYSGIW